MKTRFSLILVLLVLVAMLSLTGCSGYSPVKGSLVMGQNYLLQSGDTLNDDLTVMGGNATLEQGSTVNGDVSVLGGTLDVDGTVNGDISVMGGSVRLNDNAVVHGSISQIGGSVTRSKTAQVDGSMNRTLPPKATMKAPAIPPAPVQAPRLNLDPIFAPFLAIFRALALAALAILVFLFAGRSMGRVGQAVLSQPVVTGGIGLLTIIVAPAMLLILAITIILLPVSILGILLVAIALVFGWLCLGLLIGQQIARMLNQNWSDPVNAGVGTLALTLLASLFDLIPCIGWLATFVIGMIGLGAVIVTRFGTGAYPSGSGPVTASARPYAGPTNPAPAAGSGNNQQSYAEGYYYAPRVVTQPGSIEAEPVPPVDVAPDLSFLNNDEPQEEQKPGEENKNGNQPQSPDINL